MRLALLTLAIIIPATVFGGQTMYVAICGHSDVPQSFVAKAKTEVELTFRAADVQLSWVACENIASAKEQLGDRLLVVRLRNDKTVRASRSVSLDTMGRAYTNEREAGYLVDAYIPSIQNFAQTFSVDPDELLGMVISHELGHLLLGPGHVDSGVMFGNWTFREAQALRKRWLRFNPDQCAVIRQELARRALGDESGKN